MFRKIISAAIMFSVLLFSLLSFGEETFVPDGFSFSGGSGRISISCEEIITGEEGTWAKIVFSSPRYTCVRLGETVYDTVRSGSVSSALIPVVLNEPMKIWATTVAISSPHEVEYTILIRVDSLRDSSGLSGLEIISSLDLRYAERFSVDFCEGGYALIEVKDSARYLVVPEGKPLPENLEPGIIHIHQPLGSVYLAATSAMALFDSLDALDAIRFVSMEKQNWYIPNAVNALECGEMKFAGKYNTPNYETLVKEDCALAIESTMILHDPKVKEMLELLNIPVFIDYSSYESHPLGRMEWIKLYGVLAGKTEEAEAFFNGKAAQIESIGMSQSSGRTVLFFYVNSGGSAVVRGPSDYIVRMIELAGGKYLPDDIDEPLGAVSSISVSMEDFYLGAVDADYLIYNAAIDEPVNSIDELTERCGLLADFRAVREGNVWCADRYLYQATDILGDFIVDVRRMLEGETDGMTFIYKLY
jgi:ABC-type Fe3+-hydroxamate transport system, periplasmic component